jgi:hypothetical protein
MYMWQSNKGKGVPQETIHDFIEKQLKTKQKDPNLSLRDIVNSMWDGKPYYPSLGELVRLQYNGREIDISDVAAKLRNGKNLKLPIIQIVKKRAAYQRYLENRKKKKEARKAEGPALPEVHLPNIILPTIPD